MGDTPVQEPVIEPLLQQDIATPRVTRPEESFSRVEAETATSLPTTETGNNGLEETQAPNQVTPDAASTEDSLVSPPADPSSSTVTHRYPLRDRDKH